MEQVVGSYQEGMGKIWERALERVGEGRESSEVLDPNDSNLTKSSQLGELGDGADGGAPLFA